LLFLVFLASLAAVQEFTEPVELCVIKITVLNEGENIPRLNFKNKQFKVTN